MGGLLLGKFGCTRYQRDEYLKVEIEIRDALKRALNTTIYGTESVRNKDSFGDMDLLVFRSENLKDTNFIKSALSYINGIVIESLHLNGNVLSFAYQPTWKSEEEKLQIDLILVEPQNWETSKVFFNYGELGNVS